MFFNHLYLKLPFLQLNLLFKFFLLLIYGLLFLLLFRLLFS